MFARGSRPNAPTRIRKQLQPGPGDAADDLEDVVHGFGRPEFSSVAVQPPRLVGAPAFVLVAGDVFDSRGCEV